MARPPYLGKDWPERKTRTARYYDGAPLALHKVPDTEKEYCAFSECGGVEIYVIADNREDAKIYARRKSPSYYRNLQWKR